MITDRSSSRDYGPSPYRAKSNASKDGSVNISKRTDNPQVYGRRMSDQPSFIPENTRARLDYRMRGSD